MYKQIGLPKGQIISKANCQAQGFFQKTNEKTSHTSKNEFFRSFFGRILGFPFYSITCIFDIHDSLKFIGHTNAVQATNYCWRRHQNRSPSIF